MGAEAMVEDRKRMKLEEVAAELAKLAEETMELLHQRVDAIVGMEPAKLEEAGKREDSVMGTLQFAMDSLQGIRAQIDRL